MLETKYKTAYRKIKPDNDYLDRIVDAYEDKKSHKSFFYVVRPALAALLIFLFVGMLGTPALAGKVPGVYRLLDKYAPQLLNYIMPEELSDSKSGIRMQLEAINIEGDEAELLISFTDEEGYDHIHGAVDLYDSYSLYCYSATSVSSSCSFLEYDEAADKAYFKVSISVDTSLDTERVDFRVRQLLTNYTETRQNIDISNISMEPKLKKAPFHGFGWNTERERPDSVSVASGNIRNADVLDCATALGALDITEENGDLWDTIKVTGVGYSDHMLRVQVCRGNLENVDRHAFMTLVKADGTELDPDWSVTWHEEIAGRRVTFDEEWFYIEEDELTGLRMYGDFYETDCPVYGNWKINFSLSD